MKNLKQKINEKIDEIDELDKSGEHFQVFGKKQQPRHDLSTT